MRRLTSLREWQLVTIAVGVCVTGSGFAWYLLTAPGAHVSHPKPAVSPPAATAKPAASPTPAPTVTATTRVVVVPLPGATRTVRPSPAPTVTVTRSPSPKPTPSHSPTPTCVIPIICLPTH